MNENLNALKYFFNLNILNNGERFESRMSKAFENFFLNLPIIPDEREEFQTIQSKDISLSSKKSRSFFQKNKIGFIEDLKAPNKINFPDTIKEPSSAKKIFANNALS